MISDVPQGSDDSSIRVTLLEGRALIREVSIENVRKEVLREDDKEGKVEQQDAGAEDDREAALKKAKEHEERKRKLVEEITTKERELNEEYERLQKERTWIESYAGQQHNPNSGVKLSLEQASTFLAYYTENLLRLDTRIDEILEELAKLASKKNTLIEVRSVKSVYLLLDEPQGALRLSLSYLMSNASWKPTYDIRVQSNSTGTVELTYHGVITNNTGEDWKDASLALSTAQPQIGGGPPPLGTLRARFPVIVRKSSYSREMDTVLMDKPSPKMRSLAAKEDFGGRGGGPSVMVAEVKESATSTSFSIPRRASINSDGKPHKVTIEIIPLAGSFSHTVIPKESQHAYLRSKATNSTKFPFLAGKANVFMDDTFVATSELKTTNPGEELTLYLGSDPTVKVEFKESVFTSIKGVVSKSSQAKYQHDITVKNSKGKEILCDIYDQLPKSQEDKAKITVLRPVIEDREREGGCTLSPKNNSLHWKVKVAPGKQFDVTYEYQIDYPADKLIEFVR